MAAGTRKRKIVRVYFLSGTPVIARARFGKLMGWLLWRCG